MQQLSDGLYAVSIHGYQGPFCTKEEQDYFLVELSTQTWCAWRGVEVQAGATIYDSYCYNRGRKENI